ncbi:MAG TPA: class I SAM-dependent methyltransferase [Burkholderiaceae bacterium]
MSFSDFLASPPGRYVLDCEQRLHDCAVPDIFGYHALQLGMPQIDTLRENRMPLRVFAFDRMPNGPLWTEPAGAAQRREVTVVTRFDELPFASQSIDLVVMPHVLEFAEEPHQVLREADRILVPEGQLIITGFNPASLWGLRHWMSRLGVRPYLPRDGMLIALPRIKDWLKLLSFEVSRGRFGCYAPWVRSEGWLSRWAFLEKAGDRWWPVLGSVYALTAVKRVRGMRLIGPAWKKREERRGTLAPAVTTQRSHRTEDAFTVRVAAPGEAANDTGARAAHG